MKCLHCKEEFTKEQMHEDRAHNMQVCQGCYAEIRAEHRATTRKHKRRTLAERNLNQKIEREAKAKRMLELLNDKTIKGKVKTKSSSMLKVDHILAERSDMKRINEECGL